MPATTAKTNDFDKIIERFLIKHGSCRRHEVFVVVVVVLGDFEARDARLASGTCTAALIMPTHAFTVTLRVSFPPRPERHFLVLTGPS